MKAVVQTIPGGELTLSEIEIPSPGHREILIRVDYTALNRMDLLQARGNYPLPPGASPILGVEVSKAFEYSHSKKTFVSFCWPCTCLPLPSFLGS